MILKLYIYTNEIPRSIEAISHSCGQVRAVSLANVRVVIRDPILPFSKCRVTTLGNLACACQYPTTSSIAQAGSFYTGNIIVHNEVPAMTCYCFHSLIVKVQCSTSGDRCPTTSSSSRVGLCGAYSALKKLSEMRLSRCKVLSTLPGQVGEVRSILSLVSVHCTRTAQYESGHLS